MIRGAASSRFLSWTNLRRKPSRKGALARLIGPGEHGSGLPSPRCLTEHKARLSSYSLSRSVPDTCRYGNALVSDSQVQGSRSRGRLENVLAWHHIRTMSSKRAKAAALEQRDQAEQEEEEIPPEPVPVREDLIRFKAVRASGPGGQNVNKVATCVEARFSVYGAKWIPKDVRKRLVDQQAHRITKAGELVVVSQEHRTQHRNRVAAIERLQAMIDQALEKPKERIISEEPPEEVKDARRAAKRHRSKNIKSFRRVDARNF
eukprot:CAMPEP_0184507168 /NCGR_PEP_ID=MMETSP0198_2-20121128/102_1 /TAXON_ID=1112570 /ORGANISM="Thraustochytrium sp., Strain LLF1b" /LENGTH=260 /DNA_ID=CAMNT_0026896905 /DNA_START=67 /DNA_END=849 /DNA_ORIENTATION=+